MLSGSQVDRSWGELLYPNYRCIGDDHVSFWRFCRCYGLCTIRCNTVFSAACGDGQKQHSCHLAFRYASGFADAMTLTGVTCHTCQRRTSSNSALHDFRVHYIAQLSTAHYDATNVPVRLHDFESSFDLIRFVIVASHTPMSIAD